MTVHMLTPDEEVLVGKWRRLDDRGRATVRLAMDKELELGAEPKEKKRVGIKRMGF